ncbi:EF-hand domain-containing protein [Streptomyces jumonjinensis]|uniref:EF-hand domain-containing protein n=1 Tax=Streptomyces jumonjinensis TaxID=1945 RepID=A0A646KTC0_STRJU|nr:EF-hand domain-containing protein [Streptomyces jumonjinensis]MQT05544.1 EF-hand domain-containing protein [Streptomyces jumonjinensis]
MSEDMLIRKIRHGFDQFDADGGGELTEADHVLMGQRSARAIGHASGSDGERRIVDAYVAVWRNLHLPHLPPGAVSMTREQFVESTLSLADDPAAARATVGILAETFLAVADTDGDGAVDLEEYFCFLRGHFPRTPREAAETAFRHLDRDGDGTLSAGEFTSAAIEFWSSRNPHAPGNWWAGVEFTA